jgi:CRP/FNR family transcriptional regulator, cyclic AMP receptor protein
MDVREFLVGSSLFSQLSPAAIYRLVELAQVRVFNPNDLILQEGQVGLGCFIIINGKVEVVKGLDAGRPKVIAELGPGEIIGEISVIDNRPHTASVRALEKTQCIMIERWDFQAQMQAYPEIALQLLPVLAGRLRSSLDYSEGQ